MWPGEQTLDDAAGMLSGRMAAVGGGVGHDVSPRRSSIQEAVGAAFCLKPATHLVGLSRGIQKNLGSCIWQGQICRFDWWFPHLGIAVDEVSTEELERRLSEFDHRREWCAERFINYTIIPPDDRRPGMFHVRQEALDALRRASEERRLELEGAGDNP